MAAGLAALLAGSSSPDWVHRAPFGSSRQASIRLRKTWKGEPAVGAGNVGCPMLRAFAAGRLFGTTYGSPPPRVLALHGWARTSADFAPVLAGLDGPALDGLALDLPGFGASPEPDEPWGAAEYAKAVAGVLDELDTPPAVVVGHSFGGRVAVHVGVARPDRVRALVLTGAPLVRRSDAPPPRPPLTFRIGKALHRRGVLSDERMEDLRRRHGSADYRTARGVMRAVHVRLVNETYEHELGALGCPVELVWGERDYQVPVSVAQAAHALLPGARLTVVPGAGHLLPLAAPAALREAIERQLP